MPSNALQCLFGISREATYAAEFVFKFFLRGRYSRSSLVCYKTVVFRSRNGYMLAVEYVSFVLKKAYFPSFSFFL